MGTIAEKLAALADTKAQLRQAIAAKGQDVTAAMPFSRYPELVAAIQTGGGTGVFPASGQITVASSAKTVTCVYPNGDKTLNSKAVTSGTLEVHGAFFISVTPALLTNYANITGTGCVIRIISGVSTKGAATALVLPTAASFRLAVSAGTGTTM